MSQQTQGKDSRFIFIHKVGGDNRPLWHSIPESPMSDWNSLTLEALRSLGADSAMVLGAKLREEMVRAGWRSKFDVSAHVASSGQSFGALIGKVAGVVVLKRPGSDMLIGLRGAKPPPFDGTLKNSVGPGGSLRKDVYEAFTRLSPVPSVYLPGSDRFVPADRAEGPSIRVPRVTREGLVRDREEFVNSLHPDAQPPLLDALKHSANPLADFHRELRNSGFIDEWMSARTNLLRSRVIEWAKENNVEPRDAWFSRAPSRMATTPHRAMTRLIPHLTVDEIRDLKIPFRAVEALLAERPEN